jgi:Divergent InlB B-repeat domain
MSGIKEYFAIGVMLLLMIGMVNASSLAAVATSGGSITCRYLANQTVINCIGVYPANTDLLITPAPSTGYAFANWSTCTGCQFLQASNTSAIIALTSDSSALLASFKSSASTHYQLDALAGVGGTVACEALSNDTTIACVGSYPAGLQVMVTATPSTGYLFSSWTCSGTCSPTAASPTLVVLNGVTVVDANFISSSTAVSTNSLTVQTFTCTRSQSKIIEGTYFNGTAFVLTVLCPNFNQTYNVTPGHPWSNSSLGLTVRVRPFNITKTMHPNSNWSNSTFGVNFACAYQPFNKTLELEPGTNWTDSMLGLTVSCPALPYPANIMGLYSNATNTIVNLRNQVYLNNSAANYCTSGNQLADSVVNLITSCIVYGLAAVAVIVVAIVYWRSHRG